MEKDAKIYVAGHRGLVGSAIVRKLEQVGYENLICKNRKELDLVNQNAVFNFFENKRPDYVFLSAARVGGIMANSTYPAEFVYENLAIETNVIHAAWKFGVKKLLFLGSSCIYPKNCPQPMKEEFLHVDDLADACLFLMDHYEDPSIINIGVGKDITISELADLVASIVGFSGNLKYDTSKPDGTLVKRLDTSRINNLGWYPKISLEEGTRHTWEWYRKNR
ncbi:NAD-dependent epimerase/dehydratase family protein [Desulfobacterales bacterium HSG16]|nr:NAD-dependent epimerase/dehydratase family protein [Desulfobacterales bacterium HSG16]